MIDLFNQPLWSQAWFVWSLSIIVIFPLSIILVGEFAGWLEHKGNALAEPVETVRNALLPVLALQVFFFRILELAADSIGGKLFTSVFWVVVIYVGLSFLNALLFEQAAEYTWRANVPTLFRDLSRFVLVLVGLAVILSTVWERDLSSLITALGVGSLVIGLALQDTLGNLFSGIAILFERPYSEGDWIEVDGTIGKVTAINWRATRLETRDGDMVVIPNSIVASSKVLNESRPPGPGYESYTISFSYNDAPNKVKQVMLDTIRSTRDVLAQPVPIVRTLSYDDSSIKYEVRFAINDFAILPNLIDEFATRVWYAAQRNNLTIPFPIRTLYHYDGKNIDKHANEHRVDSSVKHLSALVPMEVEDKTFTDEVALQHFATGEVIIAEGERANVLCTILSGKVSMQLGRKEKILSLGKGDIFGASSMLRGEASSCSYIALQDVEIIALSLAAVMQMVSRKPGFARELEEVIEAREDSVKKARQKSLKLSRSV